MQIKKKIKQKYKNFLKILATKINLVDVVN